MWDRFYNFKNNKESKNDYLLFLKKKYNDMINSVSDTESNVFNKIIEYLNKNF